MANEYQEFLRSHMNGWGRIPLQKQDGVRTFKFIDNHDAPNELDSKLDLEIITSRKTTKQSQYSYKYVRDMAEWYYPESKYVNTPNFVMRSVAFPQRQFSKVLTEANTYFAQAIPFKLPIDINDLLKQSVLDVLNYFNDPYPTYHDALLQLQRGEAFARAFSRRFLVTFEPNTEYPLLVYKNNVIGYDRDDVIICKPEAEKMRDIIISVTHKGVIFQ